MSLSRDLSLPMLANCPNCGARLRLTGHAEDRESYDAHRRCYYCAQTSLIARSLFATSARHPVPVTNAHIPLTRAEVQYIIAQAPGFIVDLTKAQELSLPRYRAVKPKPKLRTLVISITTRWENEITVWRCAARLLYGTGNNS